MNKAEDICIGEQRNKKIRFSPYLLFAFLIPAVIFLALYLIRKVYPIGGNSVLVLDLNAQYVYFYEELRDILHGDGSLLYSWQRALGGEFMGMFAYYIASPFNFIIALFPEKYITEALLLIFTLKAGLSGFNFAVYLHYSGRAKNKFVTLAFSAMYALTSYAIVNAHNSMWIDALMLLPILTLAIENLINRKKYILYTLVLAVIVTANFYIGYMVCIYVVLYSFYYYFAYGYSDEYNETGEKLHFLKSFLRVLVFSVIALAMAAVIIFTVYYSLKFGKNEFSDPNFDLRSKFNFFSLFAKFLPDSYDTVRPSGLPFVYCGILSLILIPVFFGVKKISPREKICSAILLLVMIFSFSASTVDIFWHGMQIPNWLNYRYSFMLCFLLLVFAHKALFFVKDVRFNRIVGVCGILVLMILIVQNEGFEFIDSVTCIWVSIIFLGLYLLILFGIHTKSTEKIASVIMLIIVCTELTINGYVTLDDLDKDVVFSSRTSYREFIDAVTPVVDYVQERDTSFYRMEKTTHRKTNDNMALDINGLSSSTSTLNQSIITLLNQMGYAAKAHWTKYLGGTPVSDSLFGIKYLISKKQLNEDILTKIYYEDGYYIYENPYALSLAFGVSEKAESLDFSEYQTPFDLMNAIVTAMLGREETVEVFKKVENVSESYTNVTHTYATSDYSKYVPTNTSQKAKITYSFSAGTEDEIFFFYPSDYPRKVSLTLNNRDFGTFFDNETDRVLSLGKFEKDQSVVLTSTLESENLYLLRDQSYFYYLDTELYKSVMTELNGSGYKITTHSDTYLDGTVNISKNGTLLYTTIPYDEGWQVICDGEEQEIIKVADSLLAVKLPEGTHRLEFRYLPDCFVLGSIVSLSAIVVFLIIIIVDLASKAARKKRKIRLKEAVDDFYSSFEFPEIDAGDGPDPQLPEADPEAPETTKEEDTEDGQN